MEEYRVKKLIECEDPIHQVWEILVNDIWKPEENIEEYFDREEKAKRFEKELNTIFFEIYRYLYENIRKKSAEYNLPLIIVDGLSIREGNLLVRDLKSEGYKVTNYSYTFSALPSTTQSFRSFIDIRYMEIKNGKIPLDISFNDPIWISYPDQILHHAGKIIPPHEAYKKTRDLILEVLSKVESGEVTIISDHGYIMLNYIWPIADRDKRFLRFIFGARRFIKNEEVGKEKIKKLMRIPEDKNYVFINGSYCYIKGRYFWPVGGYTSSIIHGGLSLMECIVPLIKIKM